MFITWNILERIVFIVAVLWAFGTNLTVRKYYRQNQKPVIPANTFALVQVASVVFILVSRYSPLNLVWLFLLSYIAGYFALTVGVLRRIAWLYGYLIALTIPSNWRRIEVPQVPNEMAVNKSPRRMVLIWGVAEILLAISLFFFWPVETGILYWVRGLIFAVLMLFGLGALRDGLFASDKEIMKKTGAGENEDKHLSQDR